MKKVIGYLVDWFRKIINSPLITVPFFVFLILFAYQKFISKAPDVLKGAFYGVIVSYFSYLFVKFSELNIKRFNCMVYIAQELNLYHNSLSDNIYQLNHILDSSHPTILFPSELSLTEAYIKDIGRTNLRQDLFMLYVGLRKFKHSLNAAVKLYERNIENFMGITFPTEEEGHKAFNEFYDFYKARIAELKKAGETLESELKECLSKLRFFLRVDRPKLNKFLLAHYSKRDYEKWLVEDKERMEKEFEESKRTLA